jgi:hypothetical protein
MPPASPFLDEDTIAVADVDAREDEPEEREPKAKAAALAALFDDPEEVGRVRRRGGGPTQWPDRGTAGSDGELEDLVMLKVRDTLRGRTTKIERDLLPREDGTFMRKGAPSRAGGRKRTAGGGRWDFTPRALQVDYGVTSWLFQIREPSHAFLATLFGMLFEGRQEAALKVVRAVPGRPSNLERELRAEVIEFANMFQARGARKPLSEFFGVSVRTISEWRKEGR